MRTPEEVDEKYSKEELLQKISQIPRWFHVIELGTTVKTPGIYDQKIKDWVLSSLPKDYSGKSVLDVGAWDGYWSFEAEKRNAKEITAIDIWQLTDEVKDKPFRTCKEILDSKVEMHELDVVNVEKLGKNFDIIQFFGVYYHMINPFLAFQNLYYVCNELLIVEGAIIESKEPVCYLLDSGELNGDPTNVFLFSPSFLVEYAKRIGFKEANFLGYGYENGIPLVKNNHIKHNRGLFILKNKRS